MHGTNIVALTNRNRVCLCCVVHWTMSHLSAHAKDCKKKKEGCERRGWTRQIDRKIDRKSAKVRGREVRQGQREEPDALHVVLEV